MMGTPSPRRTFSGLEINQLVYQYFCPCQEQDGVPKEIYWGYIRSREAQTLNGEEDQISFGRHGTSRGIADVAAQGDTARDELATVTRGHPHT